MLCGYSFNDVVFLSTDQGSMSIRFFGFFCGSATTTAPATSTATATTTATAERLFEALRVYCLVRGLVVPRFCKGDKELRVCGFFGGSATERLSEALRANNVEDFGVELRH